MQKFNFDWNDTKKKMAAPPVQQGGYKKVEGLYSPEFSKQGTVNVLIRFLPPMRDAQGKICDVDFPYVGPIYYHNISEHKRWMNVDCPTSIGLPCPVCETNKENWDDYTPLQRKRCRKINYYSNILIVKDHLHPENEGKVFLFRYGKKIYEKMTEKSNPPSDSLVTQSDYWDYYKGSNFKLIIKKVKLEHDSTAQNEYSSSCFEDSLTPIADSDEKIEAIMKACYPLKHFIDVASFDSYDVLAKKFVKITNQNSSAAPKNNKSSEEVEDDDITPDALDVASAEDTDDIFSKIKSDD